MKDTLLFALQTTIIAMTAIAMSIVCPAGLDLIADGIYIAGMALLAGGIFCGSAIGFATLKWMWGRIP